MKCYTEPRRGGRLGAFRRADAHSERGRLMRARPSEPGVEVIAPTAHCVHTPASASARGNQSRSSSGE